MTRVDAIGDGSPAGRGVSPSASPFARRPRRAPRRRLDVLAAVFVGGCLGGLVRDVVVRAWPSGPTAFPWPVLAVNLAGAFVLAVLLVLVADGWHSRYARPLLGTGFCGALTTFGSVVVTADQMISHGAGGRAAAYLLASAAGGVVAAVCGLVLARSVHVVGRRRPTERGV